MTDLVFGRDRSLLLKSRVCFQSFVNESKSFYQKKKFISMSNLVREIGMPHSSTSIKLIIIILLLLLLQKVRDSSNMNLPSNIGKNHIYVSTVNVCVMNEKVKDNSKIANHKARTLGGLRLGWHNLPKASKVHVLACCHLKWA